MDSQNVIPQPKNPNTTTVCRLYGALASGNTRISSLIATDLEWWFHGPQNCHHMMKMLTGKSSPSDFKFVPRRIEAIDGGECVVVEGWEGDQVYWVHVWTLKDGVITQFREYFNTWLMVKDLRPIKCSPRSTAITLWQSHREDRSLPGLMLAI
ncbi:wound-induced protein 1 [Phtheirospermum japonicum]|uniref:Wound-induced protein 1 n=1 Tax=Phtheirospermum japonicum TaxID=374723 RepID=A0A830BEK7_9LAMI|nr:wound-induced protein 1 [Phtheirospermum japonicum]